MNLSQPSESVVPTLDGPVLNTLARLTRPVTGRQIHQLAGIGSEAGVRKVLTRLVGQGVVRVNEAGSALLYHANREHVAWPAVQALARLWAEFLDRLRAELATWTPPARSAALFGSAARRDGGTDSDVDIVLVRSPRVGTDDNAWQEQLARLRELVAAWTGNTCQVYDVDGDDLRRHIDARDPIVTEWARDAATVSGTDFRSMLRHLGYRRAR